MRLEEVFVALQQDELATYCRSRYSNTNAEKAQGKICLSL